MDSLFSIYSSLLSSFGHQNWWPMRNGFMPAEFEVCIGAVLAQNTNWKNVEKALDLMKARGFASPLAVSTAGIGALERAVRPSGFYRQKAVRLKTLSSFIVGFGGFNGFSRHASRERLLGLKGIGPETADSILLYAIGVPVFVIDAYTKRVFARLGVMPTAKQRQKESTDYDGWQRLFHRNLPNDAEIYKEFHALIVELAKRHCRKKPVCERCPLGRICAAGAQTLL